jgi:hypothetical protein
MMQDRPLFSKKGQVVKEMWFVDATMSGWGDEQIRRGKGKIEGINTT